MKIINLSILLKNVISIFNPKQAIDEILDPQYNEYLKEISEKGTNIENERNKRDQDTINSYQRSTELLQIDHYDKLFGRIYGGYLERGINVYRFIDSIYQRSYTKKAFQSEFFFSKTEINNRKELDILSANGVFDIARQERLLNKIVGKINNPLDIKFDTYLLKKKDNLETQFKLEKKDERKDILNIKLKETEEQSLKSWDSYESKKYKDKNPKFINNKKRNYIQKMKNSTQAIFEKDMLKDIEREWEDAKPSILHDNLSDETKIEYDLMQKNHMEKNNIIQSHINYDINEEHINKDFNGIYDNDIDDAPDKEDEINIGDTEYVLDYKEDKEYDIDFIGDHSEDYYMYQEQLNNMKEYEKQRLPTFGNQKILFKDRKHVYVSLQKLFSQHKELDNAKFDICPISNLPRGRMRSNGQHTIPDDYVRDIAPLNEREKDELAQLNSSNKALAQDLQEAAWQAKNPYRSSWQIPGFLKAIGKTIKDGAKRAIPMEAHLLNYKRKQWWFNRKENKKYKEGLRNSQIYLKRMYPAFTGPRLSRTELARVYRRDALRRMGLNGVDYTPVKLLALGGIYMAGKQVIDHVQHQEEAVANAMIEVSGAFLEAGAKQLADVTQQLTDSGTFGTMGAMQSMAVHMKQSMLMQFRKTLGSDALATKLGQYGGGQLTINNLI